jgi:hypothetical protein
LGGAGSVGVLMGNGDWTYQPAVIYYSYSGVVASLAVADVNGDGKPDVLVATSATTVKSSLNPSLSGQTVTFTATVTSPQTTPTGTVTFNDGSNTLGTETVSGGRARYSTTTLRTGSNSISVIYNGTANINGSTSATLVQNVN